VSRTVREIVGDSGLPFEKHGTLHVGGGSFELFSV
jgi:hypothetical protein